MTLPSGTVTFLLTDIEGSTRLTQALGERWPAILARHFEILRAAMSAGEGTEFGTEGDALFAAFGSAPRALEAAAAAQRALASESWPPDGTIRVRMGIHTGEATVGGGTYVGVEIHRAARIAAAGHGGQVVVSRTTRMLAEGQIPAGLAFRELGEYRLKDLLRPEHLSQLEIDGLPSEFPALRTLDSVPNNLPVQLTTFLGREGELAEAQRLLVDARLLTLTGPGGTGKTRLSLQLAADATEQFRDGVYFVPLGTIAQPALVLPTVGQAMGLPDPGRETLGRLVAHLADKQVLILLDNVEQVLDAAPEIGELLTRAASIKILATSRSPLRIYGEREYPVPPLSLPDPGHLPDAAALSQYASVALFVERAMAVKPDFAVTASNAPSIAEICIRLDGLPLAIELAAARVRVLSPQAILARLGDRLTLLGGGARNLPERQQTLRGAIDWSYELLDAADRCVFSRFSALSGGGSQAAAEAIVLPAWPPDAGALPDALDALISLVDKSLVQQEMVGDGEPRFRMLGTIGEYAAERLGEAGEEDAVRQRHADYYVDLAESLAARVMGPEQLAVLAEMGQEHDNLRAALNHATTGKRGELGLRLLAACWRFWQIRGFLAEGREWAEQVLAIPDVAEHPEALLGGLDAAAGIAYWQADVDTARRWYGEERALAEQLGDDAAVAEAIYSLSFSYSLNDADVPFAKELAHDALERFRALGDRSGEGRALWAVVNALAFESDPVAALELVDQAIVIFRETNDRFQLGWALYTQALGRTMLKDYAGSRASLEESLRIFHATGDVSGYALLLDAVATLEWVQGNRERAMVIAGAASAIQDLAGVGLAAKNREIGQFFPQDLLAEAPLAEAYAAGRNLSTDEAVRLALGEGGPADA